MSEPLLMVENLSAGYGGRPVLESFQIRLAVGERVALIGPNGCGKSTFLRTVTAEVPESHGRIYFLGEDITDLVTEQIVARGIGYLRQTRNIFPSLSVAENLELARLDGRRQQARDTAEVLDAFPALRGREAVRAGLLSGGERQSLAAAMVLMRPVRLLFLDEPLAGLSQENAAQMLAGVAQLQKKDGFAIVIVEHRLKLIRPHVDRVVIMARGCIAEDTSDPSVLEDRVRLEKHYQL